LAWERPDELGLAPIPSISLRRALGQLVGQFNGAAVGSQRTRIKRAIHAPSLLLPSPTSCAVGTADCSLRPCVQFATSATTAVLTLATTAVLTPPGAAPSVSRGPRAAPCRRTGGPAQTEAVALAR
jgi:hypothetical protein